jgi:hypothetical protein
VQAALVGKDAPGHRPIARLKAVRIMSVAVSMNDIAATCGRWVRIRFRLLIFGLLRGQLPGCNLQPFSDGIDIECHAASSVAPNAMSAPIQLVSVILAVRAAARPRR